MRSRTVLAMIEAALIAGSFASPSTTARAGHGIGFGRWLPSTSAYAGGIGERRERAPHAEHRRPEDVVAVDLVDIDGDDRKRERARANQHGQPIAIVFAKHLRIGEADDGLLRIEDHGGDDDRPCERTASGFVDAGERFVILARRAAAHFVCRRSIQRCTRTVVSCRGSGATAFILREDP